MHIVYKRTPKQHILSMVCLLLLIVGFAGPASAQSDAATFVIGELSNIPYLVDDNGIIWGRQGFMRAALAEMGYVEGENVTYLFNPEGYIATNMEAAAQELVEANPDMLIAYGTAAAEMLKVVASGTSIPIVFVGTVDPVESGLVTSLQTPEGNITGVGSSSEAYGKQLEWLMLIDPTIESVYIPHLVQDSLATTTLYNASVKAIQEFADASGIEVIIADIPSAEEAVINEAVEALLELKPDAIMTVVGSPAATPFIEASLTLDVPLTTSFPIALASGPMLSYNITEEGVAVQAARYVDLILRGAAPSSLPVELAPNSLGINLVTADAIGIEITDDILLQTEIIVRQEG